MEWHVNFVEVVEHLALRVRFVDGNGGLVCFEPEFFQGAYEHLEKPEAFAEVFVNQGAVSWPGGLELTPETMYDMLVRSNGIITVLKAS